MSSAEFSLWIESYKEDQWGDKWQDWRTGVIASTIANFAGKTLANGHPGTDPKDFMPNFDQEDVVIEPDPVAFFTAIANDQKFPTKG